MLGFAKRLSLAATHYRFVVLDLRNHGASQHAPPGDDLESVARDLIRLGQEVGMPSTLIAHSYGGKVALKYAEIRSEDELDLWILDTCPSRREIDFSQPEKQVVLKVLQSLKKVTPPPPSREETMVLLEKTGLRPSIAMWLCTNLVRKDSGLAWVFELERIKAMITDYYAFDAWPLYEQGVGKAFIHFVRGAKSDRFIEEDIERLETLSQIGAIDLYTLENAGHWVHIDQSNDLLAIIIASLR